MKNLKLLLLAFLCIGSTLSSTSQVLRPSWSNGSESYSQMWNPTPNSAGAYWNDDTQIGNQLDTFSGVGYLATSRLLLRTSPLLDTVTYSPIYGFGKMNFEIQLYTGDGSADHAEVGLWQCNDAISWVRVEGTPLDTVVTTTSHTTPKFLRFSFVDKAALYYQLRINSFTGTAAVSAEYTYQKIPWLW